MEVSTEGFGKLRQISGHLEGYVQSCAHSQKRPKKGSNFLHMADFKDMQKQDVKAKAEL